MGTNQPDTPPGLRRGSGTGGNLRAAKTEHQGADLVLARIQKGAFRSLVRRGFDDFDIEVVRQVLQKSTCHLFHTFSVRRNTPGSCRRRIDAPLERTGRDAGVACVAL